MRRWLAYPAIYRAFYYGAYERLRGRATLRLIREAEERQWWSRERLLEWQRERLARILEIAWERTTYYREAMAAVDAGPGASEDPVARLERLPPLERETIQRRFADLVARDHPHRLLVKGTGGSTGEPVRVGYDDPTYRRRLALVQRAYSWAGCQAGARVAYLWGGAPGAVPARTRWKLRLDDWLANRKVINTFGAGSQRFQDWEEAIRAFSPRALVTYTTPGYELARWMAERQRPPLGLRAVVTAAEGVFAHQRALMERILGGRVFESYGAREVTSIAMECEAHRGLHWNADGLWLEIRRGDRPAKPGEIGELWITDLVNEAFPLIRYRLGDLAVAAEGTCPCGRGLPLLERVEGRVLDALTTPEGEIIPGEFFPHLLRNYHEIRRFQVVQDAPDHIVLRVAPAVPLPSAVREEILALTRARLGPTVRFELETVDAIPPAPSGKLRVTRNLLRERR
jgi:phenylacetate-CoA ligase